MNIAKSSRLRWYQLICPGLRLSPGLPSKYLVSMLSGRGTASQEPGSAYHGKKASRQSNGPFCSSGVSRACLTNPHKCPWRPPAPSAFDNTNSVADRRESSRQNFLRARSVRGLSGTPLANQTRLLLPPLLCVPAYSTEALASSKRLYLTQTSPVFERIIGNPALSSAAIES